MATLEDDIGQKEVPENNVGDKVNSSSLQLTWLALAVVLVLASRGSWRGSSPSLSQVANMC